MGEVKEMGKVKEINNPQMLPQKPFTGSFFSQCGWKEASSNTEAVAENEAFKRFKFESKLVSNSVTRIACSKDKNIICSSRSQVVFPSAVG